MLAEEKTPEKKSGGSRYFHSSENSSEISSELPKILPNGSAAIAKGATHVYLCTCHSDMDGADMNRAWTRRRADDAIF
jgi:hypothetical protein